MTRRKRFFREALAAAAPVSGEQPVPAKQPAPGSTVININTLLVTQSNNRNLTVHRAEPAVPEGKPCGQPSPEEPRTPGESPVPAPEEPPMSETERRRHYRTCHGIAGDYGLYPAMRKRMADAWGATSMESLGGQALKELLAYLRELERKALDPR